VANLIKIFEVYIELVLLGYIHTFQQGFKALTVSIKNNKFLVNLLMRGCLSFEDLPCKQEADVEIVDLILFLDIPDRNRIQNVISLL